MKPELLLTKPIFEPTVAELEREFTVHRLWTAPDPEGYLAASCANVRAAVTTGIGGFSRGRIDALPRLEIIACFGNPHEGTVDLAAAKARSIVVTNTPDAIQDLVSELAIGLAIALLRRICENDRFVRAGSWVGGVPPMGTTLIGKTCGIVGLGRIGRGVARRAEACGMKVCYHGPRQKDGVDFPYYADLEALARAADCLIVTCPLTPATRGLVNARVLEALGERGFLVNVARGPVVEQEALLAALSGRRIAGAGLDVFWDEPRVPQALMTMDHVVLAPHIGSSTREVREERGRKLLANLRAHFSGQAVVNPIT